MNQDQLKEMVAREALKHVVEDAVIGVGSGSTVFKFIDCLSEVKNKIQGAVAASEASAERLKKHGIRVFDLNSVNELPVYIDGALVWDLEHPARFLYGVVQLPVGHRPGRDVRGGGDHDASGSDAGDVHRRDHRGWRTCQ